MKRNNKNIITWTIAVLATISIAARAHYGLPTHWSAVFWPLLWAFAAQGAA